MRRIGLCLLSSVIAMMLLPAAIAAEGVLEHRSWQFHDADWDYLATAIPKAAEAGMNRIQLSHNIVMDAEELWQRKGHEQKLDLVRKAVQLAHQHGLQVDMWTHELSGLPDDRFRDPTSGKVRLSDELWQWVRDKYEHLFKLVPDLDGLVLTFAETDHSVYKPDVVSDVSPPERVGQLIKAMSDVCAARGKLLIVRTFVYQPHEIDFLHQALAAVARQSGGANHIVVMTKCVPHDWTPYYPFNPLLGDVAGLPQVVEIDLGQEFTGQSRLLHCEVDYVKRVIDYARSRNVIGGVARVGRKNNHALGTPNEVNIYAFSRLLHDGGLSADALWKGWAVRRYGEAARGVIPVLKRTYEITNLIYFPLEYWIANHSGVPDWGYAYGHITSRENCKWIASPKQVLARDELLRPNADTLMKIGHEKDLARKLAEASRRDLVEVMPHLADRDYQELAGYLDLAMYNVEAFRYHNLAMFSLLWYQDRAGAADADLDELAMIQRQVESNVRGLREWADRMAKRFGDDVWPGNPGRLRAFADDVEKRLKARLKQ